MSSIVEQLSQWFETLSHVLDCRTNVPFVCDIELDVLLKQLGQWFYNVKAQTIETMVLQCEATT